MPLLLTASALELNSPSKGAKPLNETSAASWRVGAMRTPAIASGRTQCAFLPCISSLRGAATESTQDCREAEVLLAVGGDHGPPGRSPRPHGHERRARCPGPW